MFAVEKRPTRPPVAPAHRYSGPEITSDYAPTPILRRSVCPCGGGCPRCAARRSSEASGQTAVPSATRLQINEPGDHHEREADHVAEQVMRMSDTSILPTHSSFLAAPSLQRKCSCGGSHDKCSACEESEAKLQRSASQPVSHSASQFAPPSVHNVLRSAGRPLDTATRGFMESRFNRDFSNVRIHTDAVAGQSARDVSARAYTVGSNIVFAADQFSPASFEGRHLLAHELAHVAQQGHAGPSLQRAPAGDKKPKDVELEIGKVDVKDTECNYNAGEKKKSASARAFVDPEVAFASYYGIQKGGQDAILVSDFEVDVSSLKPSMVSELRKGYWIDNVEKSTLPIEIIGYTDCAGWESRNSALREQRAHNVARLFPKAAPQIRMVGPADYDSFLTDNANPHARALNRSVLIRFIHPPEPKPKPKPKPKHEGPLCGPDVTEQVAAAVSGIKSSFLALSPGGRKDVCGTLNSLFSGGSTWDIVELYRHNNSWIYKQYRPACANEGGHPVCGDTVQVGNQCYYSGSANYVIFGVMCRLCQQHLDPDDASDYDERHMLDLIELYKGSGAFHGASGNYEFSRQWARAGYDGWPGGGYPPHGDRNNCAPICPTAYFGNPFHVRWCPHIDPVHQCGGRR